MTICFESDAMPSQCCKLGVNEGRCFVSSTTGQLYQANALSVQAIWVSSDAQWAVSMLCLVSQGAERSLGYARIEVEKNNERNAKNHEVNVDPVRESFPRAASQGKACWSSSGSLAQASTLRFTWI